MSNAEVLELLRMSGDRLNLRLTRHRRGPVFEQLQKFIDRTPPPFVVFALRSSPLAAQSSQMSASPLGAGRLSSPAPSRSPSIDRPSRPSRQQQQPAAPSASSAQSESEDCRNTVINASAAEVAAPTLESSQQFQHSDPSQQQKPSNSNRSSLRDSPQPADVHASPSAQTDERIASSAISPSVSPASVSGTTEPQPQPQASCALLSAVPQQTRTSDAINTKHILPPPPPPPMTSSTVAAANLNSTTRT